MPETLSSTLRFPASDVAQLSPDTRLISADGAEGEIVANARLLTCDGLNGECDSPGQQVQGTVGDFQLPIGIHFDTAS